MDFGFGPGFAVDFDVGVDEVVQRFAGLAGDQDEVAARREGQAVFGDVAEEVVLLLGVFVGFGNVDGNPAVILDEEVRPTVVTANGS